MKISVTKAKGHLAELVRRAEAGEEIILTRHGQPAARLADHGNVGSLADTVRSPA